MFLKLYRKAAEENEFEQRISLILLDFGSLVDNAEMILESVNQEKLAKDCSTKPPPNKRPKLQHDSFRK